jgi:amino acid adenylation domain-containing protein
MVDDSTLAAGPEASQPVNASSDDRSAVEEKKMTTPADRPFLLSQLIPAAAERDAEATALSDGTDRISYRALEGRVGRLSAALQDRGVRDGDRVVIHAPKSIDSFVAMHAAMRAGGIAVPVNPRLGGRAIADIVGSIEPAAAVLHPTTAGRWPAETRVAVTVGTGLAHSTDHLSWDEVEAGDARGPANRAGADPAYMITTSGSTGTPKSIVHTHRSGLRYAELAAECYDLGAGDVMANVAPFHFDQSTFELYAGPLVGAGVVLVPDVLLRFPANVATLVESEKVTVWYSVPTILRQLLDRGGLSDTTLRSLRWVLFGGEIFPANELRALMHLAPGARFSNVYGPAEVNQCTFHHLDAAPADGESIPIGVAWGDTRCRIVARRTDTTDEHAHVGELLVHSSTAMAGYWNQPELTAAAFVDEVGPGGLVTRWYRTGDLVERDGNGLLHFRGRIDRQVKVRGVRIELEAIEAALNAIEGVSASAAGVTRTGSLAAIIESATLTDITSLRRGLAESLSPESQPEFVEITTSLPRTGSDKVDHAAVAALIAPLGGDTTH